MNVAYCKNSTLREAYAAVIGLPAVPDPAEREALGMRYARVWPEHERSTWFVEQTPFAPEAGAEMAPAWVTQLAWEQRRWVGRWGHRTTGLHRAILEGEVYSTFDRTMRPTLARWLEATRDAYTFLDIDPPAATVVFGYINAFLLRQEDGDLSEWFKLNISVDAAGAAAGINELTCSFRIPRIDHGARVNLKLEARQEQSGVRVTVETLVERDVSVPMTFSHIEGLLDELHHARVLAKETFFSFVTERTLTFVGATDAVQPEA